MGSDVREVPVDSLSSQGLAWSHKMKLRTSKLATGRPYADRVNSSAVIIVQGGNMGAEHEESGFEDHWLGG